MALSTGARRIQSVVVLAESDEEQIRAAFFVILQASYTTLSTVFRFYTENCLFNVRHCYVGFQ